MTSTLLIAMMIVLYACQTLFCRLYNQRYPGEESTSPFVYNVIYGVFVSIVTFAVGKGPLRAVDGDGSAGASERRGAVWLQPVADQGDGQRLLCRGKPVPAGGRHPDSALPVRDRVPRAAERAAIRGRGGDAGGVPVPESGRHRGRQEGKEGEDGRQPPVPAVLHPPVPVQRPVRRAPERAAGGHGQHAARGDDHRHLPLHGASGLRDAALKARPKQPRGVPPDEKLGALPCFCAAFPPPRR